MISERIGGLEVLQASSTFIAASQRARNAREEETLSLASLSFHGLGQWMPSLYKVTNQRALAFMERPTLCRAPHM